MSNPLRVSFTREKKETERGGGLQNESDEEADVEPDPDSGCGGESVPPHTISSESKRMGRECPRGRRKHGQEEQE